MLIAHADSAHVFGPAAVLLLLVDITIHAGNVVVLAHYIKDKMRGKKAHLPACGCSTKGTT